MVFNEATNIDLVESIYRLTSKLVKKKSFVIYLWIYPFLETKELSMRINDNIYFVDITFNHRQQEWKHVSPFDLWVYPTIVRKIIFFRTFTMPATYVQRSCILTYANVIVRLANRESLIVVYLQQNRRKK